MLDKFIYILIIAAVFVDANGCKKSGSSRSPTAQVKSAIFCNYDKEIRPIKDQKKAINVTTRIVLKSVDIITYDETEMSVQNWMGATWKDEYLTWKAKDFNSLELIHITSDEIWTPDIRIHAEESLKLFDSPVDCLLFQTGIVVCVSENMHTAKCKEDINNWPYDAQTCNMKLTTTTYNTSQVRLKGRVFFNEFMDSTEWELNDVTSQVLPYKVKDQSHQYVSFDFKIERHTTRLQTTIFVPAMSLVITTLGPLWNNFENAEKLCLISSGILSHLLFIQQITWLIPNYGPNLPKIVNFLQLSLCLAVCVLLKLTIIKTILSQRTTKQNWILGTYKMLTNNPFASKILTEETQEEETNQENSNKPKENIESLLIVNIVDKLIFIVYFIIYFVMFLKLLPF